MPPKSDPFSETTLSSETHRALQQLLQKDPYLQPYEDSIARRLLKIESTENQLTQGKIRLEDFASGHEYFGLHYRDNKWVLREWAPNASRIYLIGNMTGWKENENYELVRLADGDVWEIRLPAQAISHQDLP